MKGYRFYAEMPENRKSKSASKAHPSFPWTVKALRRKIEDGSFRYGEHRPCVTAVEVGQSGCPLISRSGMLSMIAAAIDGCHRSYGWTNGSHEYLAKRTTRIPEDLARALSPELFRYLES